MYIIDTYLDKDRLPVLEKKELCRETQTLNSPDMTFDFLNRYFRLKDRTEEYIYLLAFDKKCHLIGVFELSHGTVDSSLITPISSSAESAIIQPKRKAVYKGEKLCC